MEINKVIYSALTTKQGKKCKYEEVLNGLGYELFKSISDQEYYGVRQIASGRELYITRNWENKTILYFSGDGIDKYYLSQAKIKKLDFVHMINKTYYNKKIKEYDYSDKLDIVIEYEYTKRELDRSMYNGVSYHEKEIENNLKKIEELKKDILYHEQRIVKEHELRKEYRNKLNIMLRK